MSFPNKVLFSQASLFDGSGQILRLGWQYDILFLFLGSVGKSKIY